MAEARERWKAAQASLDPKTLVFIDETGTNTKMVRAYGRCRKGRRLIGKQPFGHWKTTTFTAGLRCDGITAPFALRRADGNCSPPHSGRSGNWPGFGVAEKV